MTHMSHMHKCLKHCFYTKVILNEINSMIIAVIVSFHKFINKVKHKL